MNKKFKKYAKKAGFVFWEKSLRKEFGENIDWSYPPYDTELAKFYDIILQKAAEIAENYNDPDPHYIVPINKQIASAIKQHFRIEE